MNDSESQYLDSIRIRALTSIMEPDWETFLHGVFEWYSTTYHTPLYEVMELPVDHVLYTYWRGVYKTMESDERYNEAIWLLETPAERASRVKENKKSEEDFMNKAMQFNDSLKSKKTSSKVDQILDKMRRKQEIKLQDKPLPEVKIPEPQPEEVTIKYMSESDFEAELDKPIPLPPPNNKK